MTSSDRKVRVALMGDVMLGRLVNDVLKHEPPVYPWGNTLSVLASADWRICNLECVLSDRGRPWNAFQKVFHFRSDAHNSDVLKAAGIDLVSIANNHVLDFEYDALIEMLETLKRRGIRFAGSGMNRDAARLVARWTLHGIRMGLIAFTDNEPSWEATADKPGLFYSPIDLDDDRAIDLRRRVARAKQDLDFLIVSAHWGPNWGYDPLPEHIPFAHALIDAGADLIFGHSPHIARGIELYKSGAIIYSAGDFIDDYAVDEIERNDRSFIFMLEFGGSRLHSIHLYPTVIRRMQAWMAMKPDSDLALNKMLGLCRSLGTQARYDRSEGSLVIDTSSAEQRL